MHQAPRGVLAPRYCIVPLLLADVDTLASRNISKWRLQTRTSRCLIHSIEKVAHKGQDKIVENHFHRHRNSLELSASFFPFPRTGTNLPTNPFPDLLLLPYDTINIGTYLPHNHRPEPKKSTPTNQHYFAAAFFIIRTDSSSYTHRVYYVARTTICSTRRLFSSIFWATSGGTGGISGA